MRPFPLLDRSLEVHAGLRGLDRNTDADVLQSRYAGAPLDGRRQGGRGRAEEHEVGPAPAADGRASGSRRVGLQPRSEAAG